MVAPFFIWRIVLTVHNYQKSIHTLKQRKWLTGKYSIFREHHDRKTLGLFFPSLHEEYFDLWPVATTEDDIRTAGGDEAKAVANLRKFEERVRDFALTDGIRFDDHISDSTDGCTTGLGQSTVQTGRVHRLP